MLLQISLILSVTSVVLAHVPLHFTPQTAAVVTNPIFESMGDSLYYFGCTEKLSWYDAFLKCRSMDSLLVSPKNSAQLDTLRTYIATSLMGESWWLSGSDLYSKGNFTWYGTGKPSSYTRRTDMKSIDNKDDNESNCITLESQTSKYEFNDFKCNMKLNYICEAEKLKGVVMTLRYA